MSLIEESFAPESFATSEWNNKTMNITPPPPKRFCIASTDQESQKRKRELETDTLKQIIEINWNEDVEDEDDDDDSREYESKHRYEARIHYLKLDLANAQLALKELEDSSRVLKDYDQALQRFNTAADTAETNIIQYKALISLVKTTPFAELIRMESLQVKQIPDLDLEPLSLYIQEILSSHYTRIKTNELRMRDEFHNKIIYEKNKKQTVIFLKMATTVLIINIACYLLLHYVGLKF
jgi:hypothetical protein